MPHPTPWLSLEPNTVAAVHVWAPAEGAVLRLEVDGDAPFRGSVVDPAGCRPSGVVPVWADVALDPGAGTGGVLDLVLDLEVANHEDSAARFRLAGAGVYPFLLLGPGVVPSHFAAPEPALGLGENGPFALWVDVPPGLRRLTLQSSLPVGHVPRAIHPDGEALPLAWHMPHYRYHVAEVQAPDGGWWELPVEGSHDGDRLTLFEGLPVFLARPPRGFPYAAVRVRVEDTAGPLPARVRATRAGRLVALRDVRPGEPAVLAVPPGPLAVTADAGFHHRSQTEGLTVAPAGGADLTLRLARTLTPDPGWRAGDHHMHSYYEDGGQSPEAVARAARAHGLDYAFVTDRRPEDLVAAGLFAHSEDGAFLALPGQEAMNPEVHCNALNTRRTLPAPDYGDETPGYAGPAEWVTGIAAEVAEGTPATLMLNHPSLPDPESTARHAYFRAWWVADAFPEIRLVENFDFPSWFARLDAGRLTGLWTTDTHDVACLPPGERRTYVHVPGQLTPAALVAALEAGRCFNTRAPGALLYLAVGGAIPGETARPEGAGNGTSWDVDVRCESNLPLDRVELICRGEIARVWRAAGAPAFRARERLVLDRWAIARAYPTEEPAPPRTGHGHHEPCIAFTNPVWIGT